MTRFIIQKIITYWSRKNATNKLCFCMHNHFHSYRRSRNFEPYFPDHSFSVCYIHILCFVGSKSFVSHCYNYYNLIQNKHSKKIGKKFRCEKNLFLLPKYLLFLCHHYCLFDHYPFQHRYHQKCQNVLWLKIIYRYKIYEIKNKYTF